MSAGRMIREVQVASHPQYKAVRVMYYGDWQEYQVQYMHHDGKPHHAATYHTDDRQDALDSLTYISTQLQGVTAA